MRTCSSTSGETPTSRGPSVQTLDEFKAILIPDFLEHVRLIYGSVIYDSSHQISHLQRRNGHKPLTDGHVDRIPSYPRHAIGSLFPSGSGSSPLTSPGRSIPLTSPNPNGENNRRLPARQDSLFRWCKSTHCRIRRGLHTSQVIRVRPDHGTGKSCLRPERTPDRKFHREDRKYLPGGVAAVIKVLNVEAGLPAACIVRFNNGERGSSYKACIDPSNSEV
jgi:hypothetical protein